jgi:hypothetical protein
VLLAILAAVVLLLLPGGLMLLAPWSVRPFLSAAFWIASWWWLPRLGPGRTAFLHGSLVAFGLLGLMRLLKPLEPRWPSRGALLAFAGMAVVFLGFPWAPRPALPEGPFDALTARLLVDRDGIPETYEPLLGGTAFGLRPSGLPGLAADIALLSSCGPLEATLLAAGAARALLLLGAFHVLRRALPAAPAALGGLCLAGGVAALGGLAPGAVLGLALALAAAPHLGSREKAPSVASGVLLGASLLCGGFASPLAVLAIGALRALRSSGEGRRVALAMAVAALVALPSLPRVGVAGLLGPPILHRVGSGEPLPDADDRAAMAWLRSETGPLAVVCAEAIPAADWIPAVAGRAVVVEGRPGPLPPGVEPAPRARPCRYRYARSPAPSADGTRFQSGPVTIVEMPNSLR